MNRLQDPYNPYYPQAPKFKQCCGVNTIYQTLPATNTLLPPNIQTAGHNEGHAVPWETNAAGPSSIKHIYTGIPNYYPIRKVYYPYNTLYGYDFSQYHDFNQKDGNNTKVQESSKIDGKYNMIGRVKRRTYTYKPYPLTDRNVKEVFEYSNDLLPYMDFRNWTKWPVQRESSLNSNLHTYPNAYIPQLQD